MKLAGAEKALFRALKTKKDTPKYGLIYHAALVGQASTKNKGKMSRSLAAKASLASRVDAFGEEANFDLGTEHRSRLEMRLRILEDGNLRKLSGTGKAKAKLEKYHGKSEIKLYPTEEDNTIPSTIIMGKKRKLSEGKVLIEEIKSEPDQEEASTSTPSDKKKKKKKKVKEEQDDDEAVAEPEQKKVKVEEESEEIPKSEKKKKKKKLIEEMETETVEPPVEEADAEEVPKSEKKKKKKKKKDQDADEDS